MLRKENKNETTNKKRKIDWKVWNNCKTAHAAGCQCNVNSLFAGQADLLICVNVTTGRRNRLAKTLHVRVFLKTNGQQLLKWPETLAHPLHCQLHCYADVCSWSQSALFKHYTSHVYSFCWTVVLKVLTQSDSLSNNLHHCFFHVCWFFLNKVVFVLHYTG